MRPRRFCFWSDFLVRTGQAFAGIGRGGLDRAAPSGTVRYSRSRCLHRVQCPARLPASQATKRVRSCFTWPKAQNLVTGRGDVSGSRPNFFFKFDARADQKMTVSVDGHNLKTGPGIPITLPNGASDAVEENAPYTLPQTGDYVLEIHANTMSDGPFGPFTLTLTIR